MKRFLSVFLILILAFACFPATADTSIQDGIPVSTLEEIPQYEGSDYVILNNNQPDFYIWQIQTAPYVSFSPFDSLGRTDAGMACLGPETLPTESRGEIGDIRPTGWHTVRYDDLIEDRYLYNRAHVIGYMLCGDNATPQNLFTGTRYLNAGSMLQFELMVGDYIEDTGNHVIFRCTPIYDGSNLVASGVQMEAYSVEDSGVLCFNVFVFNIQPGITIDYATGDSERSEDASAADVVSRELSPASSEAQEDAQTVSSQPTYILNTNTKKFHYPSCSSVRDMKEKNKQEFYGTRDEAIAMGYSPCGRCHP